jgi:hypothetical protein
MSSSSPVCITRGRECGRIMVRLSAGIGKPPNKVTRKLSSISQHVFTRKRGAARL